MKSFPSTVILILTTYIALLCASCAKHEDEPTSSTAATQNWKLDTTAYIITRVTRVDKMLAAVGPVGLLSFSFASFPTASGTYTVGDPQASASNVAIEARTGNDYVGLSGIVIVTVIAGKITVDGGNIRMLDVPMFKDTSLLSAHLTGQ